MKTFLTIVCVLGIGACSSNQGLVEYKKFDRETKAILILKDEATREGVLPIIVAWFKENNFNATVINALNEINPDDYIFTYRAWWGWDLKTYMRKVEMAVKSKGETLGRLQFDALQYGGFGKFGDTEKRLRILLDVLFGKITVEEANKLLGDA